MLQFCVSKLCLTLFWAYLSPFLPEPTELIGKGREPQWLVLWQALGLFELWWQAARLQRPFGAPSLLLPCLSRDAEEEWMLGLGEGSGAGLPWTFVLPHRRQPTEDTGSLLPRLSTSHQGDSSASKFSRRRVRGGSACPGWGAEGGHRIKETVDKQGQEKEKSEREGGLQGDLSWYRWRERRGFKEFVKM